MLGGRQPRGRLWRGGSYRPASRRRGHSRPKGEGKSDTALGDANAWDSRTTGVPWRGGIRRPLSRKRGQSSVPQAGRGREGRSQGNLMRSPLFRIQVDALSRSHAGNPAILRRASFRQSAFRILAVGRFAVDPLLSINLPCILLKS